MMETLAFNELNKYNFPFLMTMTQVDIPKTFPYKVSKHALPAITKLTYK